MKSHNLNTALQAPGISRREWLWQSGGGLGGIALASLLAEQSQGAIPETTTGMGGVVHPLHVPAKAKRVVQLFMSGAASHVDTFDYKPALIEQHGQKWDPGEKVELFRMEWAKP
ncbi:MAG: DUF1501 domain-containing protein [Planctomycetaceae bacterium]